MRATSWTTAVVLRVEGEGVGIVSVRGDDFCRRPAGTNVGIAGGEFDGCRTISWDQRSTIVVLVEIHLHAIGLDAASQQADQRSEVEYWLHIEEVVLSRQLWKAIEIWET